MARTRKLEQILEALEQAGTREALQHASIALRAHYRVGHVFYTWVDAAGAEYGCGTYPDPWLQRYADSGYIRVDPVVTGCYQRFQPVDWKRLDWSAKAARALLADAVANGIGPQGFTVPIRGPNGQFALFTLNDVCSDAAWEKFTDLHRRDLILIAHCFNQKALEFEPGRAPHKAKALSPREIDAITLLAGGRSRAQVADTLSISQNTLRVYIESARFKLGAVNTTHAVARALSRGLIIV